MLQVPGWRLLGYLVFAQGLAALRYELGVSLGTQAPAAAVTEVGAAFWYGFALGDLLTYIPLLGAGLIGHLRAKPWGRVFLPAALGITLYWPVVCLATMVAARDAAGWRLVDERPYWLVLPLIMAWAAWGLWASLREAQRGAG